MDLCLFSVSYAGLWGQAHLGLEPFIARASRLGYRQVMLMGKRPHLSPLDMTEERLVRLRAALSRARVTCPVIGGYTDFAGGSAAEVPSAEMQIAYVEALARIGAALHPHPIVRLFTSYDRGAMRQAWGQTVSCVRECSDRAAAHGAVIAVQNHHDLAVHTDALLEFLACVDRPNVRLGFDAWSPAARGEDLYGAARRAAPLTAITTNADYVRLPGFRYDADRIAYTAAPDFLHAVPFGTGFIDYPAYWRGLADGGFRGILSYEMCSPLRGGGGEANLDRCARAYVAWMNRHAGACGIGAPPAPASRTRKDHTT